MCIWPILFHGRSHISLNLLPMKSNQSFNKKWEKERREDSCTMTAGLTAQIQTGTRRKNEIFLSSRASIQEPARQSLKSWGQSFDFQSHCLGFHFILFYFFHLTLSERFLSILQATHMLESQRSLGSIIEVVIIHYFFLMEQARGSILNLL